jgi:2,3-bisphosphoglycerate-dependent phosphoglycerate mutase
MNRTQTVAVALVLLGALAAPARAQRAIFVVRHAERADAGMNATPDPLLSAAGEARAERLADMLLDTGVTAIYSTEYQRTIRTVQPLAQRLGLEVQQVPAKDTAALIARVQRSKPSDAVVVAGHSNTLPEILTALGDPEPVTIKDDEYDNLFVVVPRKGEAPVVLRLKY